MSDVSLKLLLVDQDPIFRLGLHVALEQVPNLQVISEAETYTAALQTLAEMAQKDSNQVNLVILELGNHLTADEHLGLKICRHLKTEYPNLPILLLSSVREQKLLLAARATGVEGYCPKGTPISELVAVMRFVSVGISCWFGDSGIKEITPHSSQTPFAIIRNNLRMSESSYIDATLAEVTAQLKTPGLLLLDRAILAGRRRELLTARWLINRLLSSPYQRKRVIETQNLKSSNSYLEESAIASLQLPLSTYPKTDSSTPNSPSLLNPKFLQAALFSSCVKKLQLNLQNVTNIPLEIDILRLDKKRELLYLI
ncbi:MAG: response regulator transcription factor, partial [Rhizonema sp. PD37]|nr:response regulator transcription factor [Rhizonema sp. PD37]